jgi:hypothetical protein
MLSEESAQIQTETVLAEIIVGFSQSDNISSGFFRERACGSMSCRILKKLSRSGFGIYSALDEVIGLILAALYVRGYATTEFLNLTQAPEALHRRTAEGIYYPRNEYEKIRQSLVEAVPSDLPPDRRGDGDFRRKLISSYQYANEYSFRTAVARTMQRVLTYDFNETRP